MQVETSQTAERRCIQWFLSTLNEVCSRPPPPNSIKPMSKPISKTCPPIAYRHTYFSNPTPHEWYKYNPTARQSGEEPQDSPAWAPQDSPVWALQDNPAAARQSGVGTTRQYGRRKTVRHGHHKTVQRRGYLNTLPTHRTVWPNFHSPASHHRQPCRHAPTRIFQGSRRPAPSRNAFWLTTSCPPVTIVTALKSSCR